MISPAVIVLLGLASSMIAHASSANKNSAVPKPKDYLAETTPDLTGEASGTYWIAFQYGMQMQTSVNNRDQSTVPNLGAVISREVRRDSGIWGLALDFSDQKDSSGAGNVSILRERVTLGLDLNFTPEVTLWQNWNIYALLGVAFFEDHVQTTIGALNATDYGTWEPILRAGFGAWFTHFKSIRLGAEVRVLESAQLNPQITGEGLLRLAWFF